MLKLLLGSLLRNALATGGGAIVAQGLVTGDQLQQIIGAVTTVGSLAWSAYQKYKTNAVITKANLNN